MYLPVFINPRPGLIRQETQSTREVTSCGQSVPLGAYSVRGRVRARQVCSGSKGKNRDVGLGPKRGLMILPIAVDSCCIEYCSEHSQNYKALKLHLCKPGQQLNNKHQG